MNDLLSLATVSLVHFLSAHLPGLSDDWWTKQVVDCLSFQRQRMVQEHGLTGLDRARLEYISGRKAEINSSLAP